MIAVKFPVEYSPTGQAKLRKRWAPNREEWQQDGTWTGLFEVPVEETDTFYEIVDEASDGEAKTTEIESEDDIPGFRMALYLF